MHDLVSLKEEKEVKHLTKVAKKEKAMEEKEKNKGKKKVHVLGGPIPTSSIVDQGL